MAGCKNGYLDVSARRLCPFVYELQRGHGVKWQRHGDALTRARREQVQAGVGRLHSGQARAQALRRLGEALAAAHGIGHVRGRVGLERVPDGAARLTRGRERTGALEFQQRQAGLCPEAAVHLHPAAERARQRQLQDIHQCPARPAL